MRTVFFGFKPTSQVTLESITQLLSSHGFHGFKIVLPAQGTYSGSARGLRKGFCFIRFRQRSDVDKCIVKLNGECNWGGKLTVAAKNGEDNAYSSDEDPSGSDVNSYDSD